MRIQSEFSREAAATSLTEVGQFMNSSNNQYSAGNYVQTRPNTPNQQSQNRQGNIDFPEIQNALASSTVSPDLRANPCNISPSTQTRQNSIPQTDNPIILSKCGVCSKVANFLCSGCQKVYYCTVQCQVRTRGRVHSVLFYIFRGTTGWVIMLNAGEQETEL